MASDDTAFSPAELDWQPISRGWITLKRLEMAIGWLLLTAVVAVPLLIFLPWWAGVAAITVGVLTLLWRLTRAHRLWAARGYAERADDLFVRRGIWFRSLTAVPYGRMQVVEVSAGPIQRRLGLATVKLVTAASSTDATIEGLAAAEAARLREHLTALGESRSGGL